MKLKKSLLTNILFGILVATALFYCSQENLLKRLELSSLDSAFRLRKNIPPNKNIVIVEITDADVSGVGRWPWKRTWEATMARALTGLGAKYVYFDIIFSEAAPEEDDKTLEEAIKESKNVYLPFVFQDTSYDINRAFLPLARFAPYIKGTGSFNIYPDIDGITRRMPLIFSAKDKIYPHAALKIILDYAGVKIKNITAKEITLSSDKSEIRIPLVDNNELLLDWYGKWKHTFKHYSFVDVLAAYQDFLENKTPKINIGDFKDSICLVAVTAIGLYDIKSVPLEPEYPGIGIFATALSNILDRNFLYVPAAWINILLLYILALLPAFLIFGEKPLRETIVVFLTGSAYFTLNFLLFQNNIWLDFTLPLCGLFTSFITVEIYNFVRVAMERQNFFNMSITDGLTGLFNIRYFKILLETEIMMARSDPTKKFAIIMSDVDLFKSFNDTYGHQVGDLVLKEVGNVLKNSVRSSDIVARYGGEEMIVLLRGSSLKDGLAVAEKTRKSLENNQIKNQSGSYKVTISLGVAIFKAGDTADLLIKRADEALYKAKETGRNRVMTLEV